jgi:hypothetical protein
MSAPHSRNPLRLDTDLLIAAHTDQIRVLIMVCGSRTDTTITTKPQINTTVDLTCQYKNQTLLVEGPEIMIRPIGTRPQSMRGRFSADQLQTMIDLYKSGATAEQVAQMHGFSKRSIKRLLQRHGVRRERHSNA